MGFFNRLKYFFIPKKMDFGTLSDPVVLALISLSGVMIATHSLDTMAIIFFIEAFVFSPFCTQFYDVKATAILGLFNHPFLEKRLTPTQKILLHMGMLIHPEKTPTLEEIKQMFPLVTYTSWETTQTLIESLCEIQGPTDFKIAILEAIQDPPMPCTYPKRDALVENKKAGLNLKARNAPSLLAPPLEKGPLRINPFLNPCYIKADPPCSVTIRP